MGYPFGKKGWRLFYDSKDFFLFSRDVKFSEDVYPSGTPKSVNIVPHDIVDIPLNVNDHFAFYDLSPPSSPVASASSNPVHPPPQNSSRSINPPSPQNLSNPPNSKPPQNANPSQPTSLINLLFIPNRSTLPNPLPLP